MRPHLGGVGDGRGAADALGWELAVGPLDRPVLLRCGERELLERLAGLFGAEPPRRSAAADPGPPAPVAPAPPGARNRAAGVPAPIEVRGSSERGAYSIQGLRGASTARDFAELVALLEEVLDEHVAAAPAPGTLLLHASALADGRAGAVLLVGPSGAGKSTSAALLCRRGLLLIGDECVPVRCGPPPFVVPSRRPFGVRADVAAWLGGALLPARRRHYLLADGLLRAPAERALRGLVLLDPGAQGVHRADAGEAFRVLLEATHHFQRDGREAFAALAELARRVPALRVGVGGREATADRLATALGQFAAEAP